MDKVTAVVIGLSTDLLLEVKSEDSKDISEELPLSNFGQSGLDRAFLMGLVYLTGIA